MSTDKNRTKQSATSQLQGLFGSDVMAEDLTFPYLDPENHPVIRNVDHDKLILINDDNCKRFAQIEDDVAESDEWTTLFE